MRTSRHSTDRTPGHRVAARRWIVAACLLVAFGPMAGVAAAEEMFVKSNEVVVRAGKGPVFDAVTTVRRGQSVNVLEKQGKWLRVSAGGKEGWVFADALSPRALDGSSLAAGGNAAAGGLGLGAAGSGAGLNQGPGVELALSGRGWDAGQYAGSNGLKADGLQKLKAVRSSVTARAWQAFAAEGNVGPK